MAFIRIVIIIIIFTETCFKCKKHWSERKYYNIKIKLTLKLKQQQYFGISFIA